MLDYQKVCTLVVRLGTPQSDALLLKLKQHVQSFESHIFDPNLHAQTLQVFEVDVDLFGGSRARPQK